MFLKIHDVKKFKNQKIKTISRKNILVQVSNFIKIFSSLIPKIFSLDQGLENCNPRAKCSPQVKNLRPAEVFAAEKIDLKTIVKNVLEVKA